MTSSFGSKHLRKWSWLAGLMCLTWHWTLLAAPNLVEPSANREARPSESPSSASLDAAEVAAKASYEEGVRLYAAGELASSLEAFERAYKLAPRFAVLFNIGQLKSALGQPVQAVAAIKRYLREGQGRIDPMRAREAEAVLIRNERLIGSVRIEVAPSDASLSLDGVPLPPGTSEVPLARGAHNVMAWRDGFRPAMKTLQVVANQGQTLTLKLDPNGAASWDGGWVRVTCQVPDTQVHAENRSVTLGTGALLLPVNLGQQTIRFRRLGYAPTAFEVNVTRGQLQLVDCKLKPLPNIPASHRATLSILTHSPSERVLVDGQPFRKGFLPAGAHRVQLLGAGQLALIKDVSLKSGESAVLRLDSTKSDGRVSAERAVETAKRDRLWAYLTGVSSVALFSTATVAYLTSARRYKRWEAAASELESGGDSVSGRLALAQDSAAIQRLDDIALGSAIGGVALAVTSMYFWFKQRPTPPPQTGSARLSWNW